MMLVYIFEIVIATYKIIERLLYMKAAGIVVEYNPFHNGHEYHLRQSKEKSGADVLVAVMSGYFLQRGEPALVSKWTRTKMALQAGADLVIELPYAFSTQKAETFANGAISILDGVGVSEVCFGSEAGTIDSFHTLVSFMEEQQSTFKKEIKHFLAEGNSYPKASALAFNELTANQDILDLSQPNNILGFHYIKAIHEQKSSMKASTIQRKSANYHDETFADHTYASATSIRKSIIGESIDPSTVRSVVPSYTLEHLMNYYEKNQVLHHWELYFPLLKYKLLTTSAEQLQHIYEAEEGLEFRLLNYIKEAETFLSFMNKIKTKRYTWNRLQRLCLHILTNTTKTEMEQIPTGEKAPYIRLLGMSDEGQAYLRKIKKHVPIPLVTTLTRENVHPLLALDIRAATCYALGYPVKLQAKKLHQEYSTPPIQYNKKAGSFK